MVTMLTAEGWSKELRKDRRAVAKLLADTKPDGEVRGRPAWLLRTILPLLNGATHPGGPAPRSAEVAEIERRNAELVAAIARLRREPDVQRRRDMVLKEGFRVPVGPVLDQCEKLIAMSSSDHDKYVTGLFRDRLVRDATSELLQLLNARLGD